MPAGFTWGICRKLIKCVWVELSWGFWWVVFCAVFVFVGFFSLWLIFSMQYKNRLACFLFSFCKVLSSSAMWILFQDRKFGRVTHSFSLFFPPFSTLGFFSETFLLSNLPVCTSCLVLQSTFHPKLCAGKSHKGQCLVEMFMLSNLISHLSNTNGLMQY